ncbi:DUF2798 domain-containing protein [Alteromonas lipolytica]|uniref:DUF2798 domain-containing protein n=1 Tax=Alteromonas lipolytica TaxID=1856405 RepID=A0A1E8FEB6_9ALTE|nr:DUF2798 domain-containing protein [Alteromonas lipolytica]OFI34274.1 hypothetical protein BFC17_20825 [Alteromonas lipolytica]
MIHPRFAPIVFSLFMAFFMSGIMSLVVTTINIGFVDELAVRWLNSWPMTFAIAWPTIMLVAPMVKRIVGRLIMQEIPVEER